MTTQAPSKAFLIRGGIAIGIVSLVLIVQSNWFRALFNKEPLPAIANATVGEVLEKDTNGNNIPDWEERLWGFDPTVLYTNGVPNAELIKQKKLALGIADENTAPLNDTDRLARELFSLTAALGQTEGVSDVALQNVASRLGSSIDIEKIGNNYSVKQLRVVKTTPESLAQYHTSISTITKKYERDSADIEVVVTALETGDFSQLSELGDTATLYKQYAKELAAISVPVGLAQYHLDIINGFYGVSESFSYLQSMGENGIDGLAGVAAYQTFSQKIILGFYNIEHYLTRYGILEE